MMSRHTFSVIADKKEHTLIEISRRFQSFQNFPYPLVYDLYQSVICPQILSPFLIVPILSWMVTWKSFTGFSEHFRFIFRDGKILGKRRTFFGKRGISDFSVI